MKRVVLKPKYLFELYKKISDGYYAPVPQVITGFSDLSYQGGIETTKDTITIKFNQERVNADSYTNFLGKKVRANNVFNIDDEVKIYGYYNTLPTNKDDALIIAGRIASFSYTTSNRSLLYSVKIVNRTEELLNTMVPTSTKLDATNNTCPLIIIQMINRLNQFHSLDKRRKIWAALSTSYLNDGQYTNITGSYGNISATKNDGIAFGSVEYSDTWKPVYYSIEKLSSPEYTGDKSVGNYIFYIKYTPVLANYQSIYGPTINELVWKPKPTNNNGSLFEGTDFEGVNLTIDVKDIQNLLIVNAGTDCQGAGILGIAYNAESIGKYGMKAGYYTGFRQVFSTVHADEKSYVTGGGSTMDADGMPATAGFPLNMSFVDRDDSTGVPNGGVLTATSKSDWNQYLRDEAKWRAVDHANGVIEKLGEPRYGLRTDLSIGSNSLVLGGIYDFVIPSYGWEGNSTNPSYKLRVVDMAHTFNNNGWTTQITANEDEKVVSETILGNTKSNV